MASLTITDNFSSDCFVGTYIFRERQSSDFSLFGTSAKYAVSPCIQEGPNSVASSVPSHAPYGSGFLKRRFPTGGLGEWNASILENCLVTPRH